MPIVEPSTSSCFHQKRWSCAGGFGPLVAPQTTTRPAGRDGGERPCPGRLADGLDDDVDALARRLLHRRDDVALGMVDGHVGAPLARCGELLVAAGGDDRADAERAAQLEGRGGDPAADAPDERPLALTHRRLRDEHPVRRLVDERERGGLLEAERLVEGEHLCRGDRDQLGVRPVAVLADDRDRRRRARSRG